MRIYLALLLMFALASCKFFGYDGPLSSGTVSSVTETANDTTAD